MNEPISSLARLLTSFPSCSVLREPFVSRVVFAQVTLLSNLLDKADQGQLIDPTLIHYSFAFCASHVHGNRPDDVATVTLEEKEKFQEIRERLRVLLERQITNFREGCAASEDIYWKLDALQTFASDLNWLEEEFRKYLNVRIKTLTSDMISKVPAGSIQRFRIQGIDEEKLNDKMYQAIRTQLEEANVALHEQSNGHAQSVFPSSLGNATAAVSTVSSMVEGDGAKVLSFFK